MKELNTKWEIFQDPSYYDMWAVRPVEYKDFNNPRLFHFKDEDTAKRFKTLIDMAKVAYESGTS